MCLGCPLSVMFPESLGVCVFSTFCHQDTLMAKFEKYWCAALMKMEGLSDQMITFPLLLLILPPSSC